MAEPTKKRKRQRGIFAIEGEWFSDLRNGVSFRPLLEVMQCLSRSPFVHRDAATEEELFYYLKKWSQKRYGAISNSLSWFPWRRRSHIDR